MNKTGYWQAVLMDAFVGFYLFPKYLMPVILAVNKAHILRIFAVNKPYKS
jgi:hypothetical protein